MMSSPSRLTRENQRARDRLQVMADVTECPAVRRGDGGDAVVLIVPDFHDQASFRVDPGSRLGEQACKDLQAVASAKERDVRGDAAEDR